MNKKIINTLSIIAVCALLSMGVRVLSIYQIDSAVSILKFNDHDGSKAVSILRPWAYLGFSRAQWLLGDIYAHGWADVPKDDEAAIYWLRRSSRDFAEDALWIAKDYAEGATVKADKAESLKWLRLAAADGNKEAATLLAKEEMR